LPVVDLAQVQHVPLHHAPAADPGVLDNTPVAVVFAILPATLETQEQSVGLWAAISASLNSLALIWLQ
jgi:hypothetical protein